MIQFFKKIYLNKTVFLVLIAELLSLFPLCAIMCAMSKQMNVFYGFIYGASLILIVSLFLAYRRRDLILMNGLISAIMIIEILRYAFVVGKYLEINTGFIIDQGLLYCLELALRTFALLVEILIAYNHYTLNTKHGNNQTKIVVNQFALLVLGFVFLGIIVVNWFANTDPWVLLSNSLLYLCDILFYGAISCCELVLSVNRIDNTMTRGNSSDIKGALWYLLMLLFGSFGLIMTYLLKELPTILVYGDLFVTILCVVGLVYYLHRKKNAVKPLFRLGQTLLFFISLGAVCFMFLFSLLVYSEFHAKLEVDAMGKISDINMTEVAKSKGTYVYQTDDLYVVFPEYNKIEYEFGNRPSKSDDSITFLGPACAIWDYELSFHHENICGDHVKAGQYYKGHERLQDLQYGTLTFYDGKGHIVTQGKPEDALKKAAKKGGDGYPSLDMISDSQLVPFYTGEIRCMRAMTEIQGRVCIIDSIVPMEVNTFEELLLKEGIKDALYMDVGAGWNYSWYRDKNGKAINFFGIPIPFSHNWVVFKR